jgi:hypothetical protein
MPGALQAANTAAGINQLLGNHAQAEVYKGNQIVTPAGAQSLLWTDYGNTTDLSQPFTMSGTTLGRVEIPLQPNGNGANVLVSLYRDSGGSPNLAAGAICSTLLPAAYLNQVCAPNGLANGGPLATSANYTRYFTGGTTTTAYLPPVFGAGGIGGANSAFASGNYIVLCGGADGIGVTNAVYSIQYQGGGVIAKGVSQPVLPVATEFGAICGTTSSMYYLGGITTASSPNAVTAVYSGAWDANTGLIGSWSSQTALPVALCNGSAAVWNGTYLYHVGGAAGSPSGSVVSTVYLNVISNGQLGAWSTTASLPVALQNAYVTIIGNWLIVAGGNSAAGSGTSPVSTVYYSQINTSTGALGTWQTGPSMPTAANIYEPGWNTITVDDCLIQFSGQTGPASFTQNMQILAWDSHGPALEWRQSAWPVGGTTFHPLGVSNGDGSWDVVVTNFGAGVFYYSKLLPVPVVSVPLPAFGLTNGATYHVVLRQFSESSASDYVAFGTLDGSPLPAAAVTNGRYASGTWTSVGAGRSVPMSVFDQTAGGPVLHTWEDASTVDLAGTGARWTAFQYGAQSQLTGLCEMTLQPNVALNSNPTFTSSVSPWTATNGTLTQSSAQTHGGFAFSGLLTPTGGFSQCYAQSENFPITQTLWGAAQWVLVTGWFYSPTGWSAFGLNVNWYTSTGAYISTSANTISLAANTWTQVSNYFQPPAGAAFASIDPTQSSSPGATNLLYISNVYMVLTPETVGSLTSAATVNYGTTPWPTGVTQLN